MIKTEDSRLAQAEDSRIAATQIPAGKWNAWKEVAEREHLIVGFVQLKPQFDMQGFLSQNVIAIYGNLDRRDRHATLTHELVHDERQIFHKDSSLCAAEELIVRRITADRLCPLEELEALTAGHSPGIEALLEHFNWCDLDSLKIQLKRLAKRRQYRNRKATQTGNHELAAA